MAQVLQTQPHAPPVFRPIHIFQKPTAGKENTIGGPLAQGDNTAVDPKALCDPVLIKNLRLTDILFAALDPSLQYLKIMTKKNLNLEN
jgi:hypothetical protein